MKMINFFLVQYVLFAFFGGSSKVFAEGGVLSIQSYDKESQLLLLNVVAPPGHGKFFLSSDGLLTELERFSKVGEFLLKVYIPCDMINDGDAIYYRVGNTSPLKVSLDSIKCQSNKDSHVKPRVIYQQGRCFIDHKGTTLWRVGSVLNELNGFTVYQNMYGVYLTNKNSFIKGELSKMMSSDVLVCPSTELLSTIDAQHAKRMFDEYELFRKNNAVSLSTSAP
ncbi:UNVERIFIED_CONTAM: hypothetical protein I5919_11000 [Aeromonas hydrophila]